MSGREYYEGDYDGMARALRIVRQVKPAPQTRCSDRQFKAAQRRIAAVLAGALRRSEGTERVGDEPQGGEER